MWRLRVNGVTQAEIAARLGITQQAVSKELRRAVDARPATAIDEYRAIELDKLDRLERVVLAVLGRKHLVISGGNVMTIDDPDGGGPVPLIDDGPVLAAAKVLVALSARRAGLVGMDSQAKVSVADVQVRYTIDGVDLAALH